MSESAGATAIRPFAIEIPEAELEELRARIAATAGLRRRPSQISRRACRSQ